MIAIGMRFLTGRFHATPWGRHHNEGQTEWPPSSWRLLRALVAAFYRTHPANMDERQLTRILNALSSPPEFRLPPSSAAHTRHYDQANGGIKFFDTFTVLNRNDSDEVVWLWPDAVLEPEDRQVLSQLLQSLNSFGRSESWCEARILENDSSLHSNCAPLHQEIPTRGEPVRVLVPNVGGAELLKELTVETSSLRKKKMIDPPGARWVTYSRPVPTPVPRPAHRKSHAVKLTWVLFKLDATVLPHVKRTIFIADAFRRAAMSKHKFIKGDEALVSPSFSGKRLDGDRRKEDHAHAFFLPFDQNRDGKLDHLLVWCREGFDADELAALNQISRVYRGSDVELLTPVLLSFGDQKGLQKLITPKTSIHPRVFESSTPFVPTRFWRKGRGEPLEWAKGEVIRECRHHDLPEPVSIEFLPSLVLPKTSRAIQWSEFNRQRREDSQNLAFGFRIAFSEPITQPVAIGYGCHFGLGQFQPVSNDA